MADIMLVQNDTKPSITFNLKDGTGAAINVTGATVKFKMRPQAAKTPVTTITLVLVTAASGVVRLDWSSGNLATAGDYEAEIEVTFSDGTIQTTPDLITLNVRSEF